MIEMIMFLVIVSIAVVGLLSTMRLNSQSSGEPVRRKQALMIAESLMEEVSLARFTWCDADDAAVLTAASVSDCAVPEALGNAGAPTEVRPYDHIYDYVTGFGADQRAFDNGAGRVVDASGATYPAGYSATLRLEEVALNGVSAGASLRIGVTVTDTVTKEQIKLQSFRLRYAPNSPP